MEKRLFTAFLITILFFVFWSYFGPKPVIQPTETQQDKEIYSEKAPLRPSLPQVKSLQPMKIEAEVEELPFTVIGNFIVTYSSTGGYIKKIAIGTEENELPFQNIGFLLQDENTKYKTQLSGNKIGFTAPGGKKKEFIFGDNTLEINLKAPGSSPMVLFSNYLRPSMIDQRYQEVFYFQEDILKRFATKKVKEGTYGNIEFAGARDRYYCFSLFKGSYDIEVTKDKDASHVYITSVPSQIMLYIGPQSVKQLKPYGLGNIVYYGFFHWISIGMIKLLHLLFSLTKNWGLSIICFAISIYFLLFPFTSKSTKAMQRMQQIQPEINELRDKYKDNPQKMQKETIELYRKYKINPLGGCLPLLFQFPIFIALYQVLFRIVELKGARFLWINDLSLPDHFLKLPTTPPFYINLLPILIVIIGLAQQKMTMTASSGSSQQKSMGLFFAVFIGVIFYGFPSALVLYWFVQNILTFIYQVRTSKIQSAHS